MLFRSAGVPEQVIERAKELLEELSDADITERAKSITVQENKIEKKKQKQPDELELAQISLFDTVKDHDIIKELSEIDLGNLTPIEALNRLYQLQNKIKNRW